ALRSLPGGVREVYALGGARLAARRKESERSVLRARRSRALGRQSWASPDGGWSLSLLQQRRAVGESSGPTQYAPLGHHRGSARRERLDGDENVGLQRGALQPSAR